MDLTDLQDVLITDIRTVMNYTDTRQRWHTGPQNYYRLAYSIKGESIHYFAGKPLVFNTDSFMFFEKGKPYDVEIRASGNALVVHFDMDCDFSVESNVYHLDKTNTIRELFIRLEREFFQKQAFFMLRCKSILYEIICQFNRQQKRNVLPARKEEQIMLAMNYLQNNYHDPSLLVETMAEVAGLSVQYFRRIFKEYFGCTPITYIRNFRVERSKDFLRSPYFSISEIAEKTGFTDIYYFSRVFSQVTGISPSKYRNNQT